MALPNTTKKSSCTPSFSSILRSLVYALEEKIWPTKYDGFFPLSTFVQTPIYHEKSYEDSANGEHQLTHTFLPVPQYTEFTQKNGEVSKLTRNLFLTLHRQNIHRQQRKLSKFLMRYQQFASHVYCWAAGPVSKMASQQEKAFCVLRFEVSRSVITVQREFRARFRKDAPCMVRLF